METGGCAMRQILDLRRWCSLESCACLRWGSCSGLECFGLKLRKPEETCKDRWRSCKWSSWNNSRLSQTSQARIVHSSNLHQPHCSRPFVQTLQTSDVWHSAKPGFVSPTADPLERARCPPKQVISGTANRWTVESFTVTFYVWNWFHCSSCCLQDFWSFQSFSLFLS